MISMSCVYAASLVSLVSVCVHGYMVKLVSVCVMSVSMHAC
jgi:hypothetical protein